MADEIAAPPEPTASTPTPASADWKGAAVAFSVAIGARTQAEADAFLAAEGLSPAPAPAADSLESSAHLKNDLGLSETQLRQMADDEVAAGRLTREQADAMLAEDGLEAAAATPPGPTDKYLAEIGYEVAKADQFELPPLLADMEAATLEDIAAAHGTVTGWLTTAKVSTETGKNLTQLAAAAAPRWEAMSEHERQVHHSATVSQLERVWGDAFDGRVQRVQRLVNEIDKKKPGFKTFVEESGAGNDYGFITILSDHAEILNGRHGKDSYGSD